MMLIGKFRTLTLAAAMLGLYTTPSWADVTAPQAPPELSDTLIDFRTKEQLTEQIYIEGKVDEQNSLQVPTVTSDLKAKVMRLSNMYQSHYEVSVPRYGMSVVRFYDLEGRPVEIAALSLDTSGYIAEKTAAPYELILRQFQGAETTLLRVRFKKYRTPALLTLKPMILVNQHQPVRTLITSLTLNYNTEQAPERVLPYRFKAVLPASQVADNSAEPVEPTELMPELASDMPGNIPGNMTGNMPGSTPGEFSSDLSDSAEEVESAEGAEPNNVAQPPVKLASRNTFALEQSLLQAALVIMPLTVSEQVDSQEVMDKLNDLMQSQPARAFGQ